MSNKNEIIHILRTQGLLPLYFHRDKETSANIMRALYQAGVRVIEYTNRGPEALTNFIHLINIRDKELAGLKLAAGTIKNKQHASDYINAGADFIISPGLNKKVCETGTGLGKFWVPGCMTPTEIMKAEQLGASLIKIFPGNLLGPSFVTAVKDVFPETLFIPTGGVKLEPQNLTDWFRSGVIAVGAGSTLITKPDMEAGNYSLIEQSARRALDMIAGVRASF